MSYWKKHFFFHPPWLFHWSHCFHFHLALHLRCFTINTLIFSFSFFFFPSTQRQMQTPTLPTLGGAKEAHRWACSQILHMMHTGFTQTSGWQGWARLAEPQSLCLCDAAPLRIVPKKTQKTHHKPHRNSLRIDQLNTCHVGWGAKQGRD